MSELILIATAGHVDHGKSTLVQCLTGTDPDRFREEKERGITIDLGYAHLSHGERTYSFVDVPGHERFIHNMLAGIGSIDAVLLIIAADESVMPQTREHALALKFLGITQVGIVLTKVDLVDQDLLQLLNLELDEWLQSFGWRQAWRVGFSSKQPPTHEHLLEKLGSFQKRAVRDGGSFRLSIDRVFTSAGSGTVVTGTVDRGSLEQDSAVSIFPGDRNARLRQMQLHGRPVTKVGPHSRAALNLAGVHYKDLRRGDLVFAGIRARPGRCVLVKLDTFQPDWSPSPKHRFHVFHLAAHLHARMLWRHGDLAALELERGYPFWALDRCLIRDGSPLRLCAGFEVIHPVLKRAKWRQVKAWLGELPTMADVEAWQEWFVSRQTEPLDAALIADYCGEPFNAGLQARVIFLDDRQFVARDFWAEAQAWISDLLAALHRENPIFEELPLSLLRGRLRESGRSDRLIQALLRWATEAGILWIQGDRTKLLAAKPVWSEGDRKRLTEFLAAMDRQTGVLDLRDLGKARDRLGTIESLLMWEQYFLRLNSDLLIRHDHLDRIVNALAAKFTGKIFSVGELKDLFNVTRKIAIPLLEYLDKINCTRRLDDGREWIAPEPPRFKSRWCPPPP